MCPQQYTLSFVIIYQTKEAGLERYACIYIKKRLLNKGLKNIYVEFKLICNEKKYLILQLTTAYLFLFISHFITNE